MITLKMNSPRQRYIFLRGLFKTILDETDKFGGREGEFGKMFPRQ